GIREFTLDAQGENISVFGDNATGKTTLFDAFSWLLFDKDSANRKDFDIKTLTEDGQAIHGLDHEVEAVLLLDSGKELTLKKTYREKWTKKRGSAKAEFTGHTVDHFIDGVPVQKKEYDARIADIIDEETFKLLTNPKYFNEHLHWQKRRQILLEVCGDVSDAEVIASDKALARLPKILQGRTLEDLRKIITSKRAKINDELKKIPVRIDEAQRSLPDISHIDADQLPADIEELRSHIREKEQELQRIQSGGEVAEKRTKLREIEGELLDLKNKHRGKVDSMVDGKRKVLQTLQTSVIELKNIIKLISSEQEYALKDIDRREKKMAELRAKWNTVNNETPNINIDDTCPTCGQSLPQDRVQEAREKALADFNRRKAERLEAITAEGKAEAAAVSELRSEMEERDKKIGSAVNELAQLEEEVSALRDEVNSIVASGGDITQEPAYRQKLAEKAAIEKEIAQLQADSREAVAKVKAYIERLTQALYALQTDQVKLKHHKDGLARIEELGQQERDLAAEYERLEQELYLTEEFIRAKVNLLEKKINSRFKLARFRLFDVQINGGVVECCETTYQGVPYSGGLNNGHRNAVGMDIINTLSEHYDFYPPIFVDNAESITVLPDMKAQVIRLVVSEADKFLRVEPAVAQQNIFKEAM
ncbi:AAA family ATPase, partial [Petrimonas mucosa]|uniref:AAA family ATPase n=1 Tax=Petrimonas mucosa TaxID=1642646 RepID=UPI00175CE6B3